MLTVSVENLPAGTTVTDLEKLFRPYGWVSAVDLKPNPTGGAGAVDLAWGGDQAVRELNGFEFRGRVLSVRGASAPVASAGPRL